MIRELITRPGHAVDRLLELPSRIEQEILNGVDALREIREGVQQIGDTPVAMLAEMTAVKDAMNETNRQLAMMNEQMTAVLKMSAPIQRAQERGERLRARLGLGAQEAETAVTAAPKPRRPGGRRGSTTT